MRRSPTKGAALTRAQRSLQLNRANRWYGHGEGHEARATFSTEHRHTENVERHRHDAPTASRARPPKSQECAQSTPREVALQMPGLLVFKTLSDALRAGYQVYDRTPNGYVVRTMLNGRWQLAIVELQR